MREFKFRCWDKHLKYWVNTEDMPILQQDDKQLIYEFGGNSLGFIFCQYTGLQDKNGKDIYESDVVEITTKYDGVFKAEIIFKESVFTIDPRKTKQVKNPDKWERKHDRVDSRGFLIGWGGNDLEIDFYPKPIKRYEVLEIEIIGNIYENPELLK